MKSPSEVLVLKKVLRERYKYQEPPIHISQIPITLYSSYLYLGLCTSKQQLEGETKTQEKLSWSYELEFSDPS